MHGLTVITGPMYSGKSTELERRLTRAKLAGHKVVAFCHEMDTRYSTTPCICTHDGNSLCAEAVANASEFYTRAKKEVDNFSFDQNYHNKYFIIGIDEVHFFDLKLVECVEYLLDELGVFEVIVSGLCLDSGANPFETMLSLMARADKLLLLRAVCKECGGEATRSFRHALSRDRILVGADECYEALCRSCYHKKSMVRKESDWLYK